MMDEDEMSKKRRDAKKKKRPSKTQIEISRGYMQLQKKRLIEECGYTPEAAEKAVIDAFQKGVKQRG